MRLKALLISLFLGLMVSTAGAITCKYAIYTDTGCMTPAGVPLICTVAEDGVNCPKYVLRKRTGACVLSFANEVCNDWANAPVEWKWACHCPAGVCQNKPALPNILNGGLKVTEAVESCGVDGNATTSSGTHPGPGTALLPGQITTYTDWPRAWECAWADASS